MSRQRGKGRIVDEFTFRRHGRLLKIPVRLVKQPEHIHSSESARLQLGPQQTNRAFFLVDCPEHNLKVQGTDIEALRADVMSRLDKTHKIEWVSYWRIEVEDSYVPSRSEGVGLELEYEAVEVGTTSDDRVVHRFPDRSTAEIWDGPVNLEDTSGKTRWALVEANDRNTAALEELCRRIRGTRKALDDFLAGEDVETNLMMLARYLLPDPKKALPAPIKAKHKKRGKKTRA